MLKQIRGKRIADGLFSLVLAAIFVLFFGECNTPLGPRVGSDNAMYLTMGTALAQGYAPYRDIFDHKGPLLFMLQMLPQWAAGGYSTLAVYVQEVVFLFAGLRILAAIARRLSAPGWLVQLVYLACLGPSMDGGNLTEEYAALFILAGLYIVVRTFDGGMIEKPRKLALSAALLGGMAMLAFLTRANNALGLCGMTLGVAVWLLAGKRFAQLGVCALGFIGGMAVCALPIVVWLMAHGALGDAFYGSIVHNMMYAETGSTSRVHTLLFESYGHTAMVLAAISCMGAAAAYIRTRKLALPLGLVLAAAMAGASCFISHKFYSHYLMVMAPIAALGAAYILALLPREAAVRRRIAALLGAMTAALLILFGVKANDNRLSEIKAQGSFAQDAQALYALVPPDERESFMAYRVEPKWYVYARALPCMRFYFLQEILADADPAVMDEIVATFENEPPKWLVIYYNRPFSPPYDTRMAAIMESEYEFVQAIGQYQLLKRKEE